MMFEAASQSGYAAMRDYFNRLNADISHYLNSNDICTPIECVKEMVDSAPDKFWRQANIKVLDTCCGNGNFHGYIAAKTPLKNLYFNEINPTRVKNISAYFGADIHLSTVDFLSFPKKEKL